MMVWVGGKKQVESGSEVETSTETVRRRVRRKVEAKGEDTRVVCHAGPDYGSLCYQLAPMSKS